MTHSPGVFLLALSLAVLTFACGGDGDVGPATPSVEATPASIPADVRAFLGQFEGEFIVQLDCRFDPETSLADCGDRGLYHIQGGALPGEVKCRVMLVRTEVRGLVCSTLDAISYYEIGSGP